MPPYKPIPVPTPWQPPQYGGSPYLQAGTTGPMLGTNAQPIPSQGNTTTFQGGVTYPNTSVNFGAFKSTQPIIPNNPPPPPTPNGYFNANGDWVGVGNDTGGGGGVNVGDKRSGGPTGTEKWTGNEWVTDWGAQGGGQPSISAEQQAITDRENQIRGDIEGGYNTYFSELDRLMGNIPGQETGQKQIVQSNYAQNVADLGSQQQQSMADLATSRRKSGEQQIKSLQDISENIRNLFQTGNVMLGTRGAGDSSAANQYSYAVTKLGSKERGNVMAQTRAIENDIADRESRLNNIVTQETGKYKTERDNKIIEVAQWFQDQQNQLIQAKASGQLQKGQSLAQLSTQLLQNAQAELIKQDTNYKNRQNALLSWATTNSKNIGQLKTNLSAIGQYNVPANQAQNITGQPTFDAQGNMTTNFYPGGGSRKEEIPKNLNQFGGMLASQLPLGNTLENILR